MPDYPYVYNIYEMGLLRPVEPGGGTRVRVFRRRQNQEQEREQEQETGSEQGEERERTAGPDSMQAWRSMLKQAIEDMNRSLEVAATPLRCILGEDGNGLYLEIRGAEGDGAVREAIGRAKIPQLLNKLRAQIGLVLDEKA